ncbi:hypothetical protein PanWU01x14_339470 [Parasponia andersonii]|uniref:Uncharacterized protein n=1 Tax=Parasponia andersonii TaxID=3476 RepID=A0A2P5AEP8_PARAD|nr:hypothetical protein PanWU01x14_339470 [Parasponia andersonii]
MNYSSTHCPPNDETERQQEREFLGKGIYVDVEETEDESTDNPPTLRRRSISTPTDGPTKEEKKIKVE